MIASQKSFALKVIDAITSLVPDAELEAIGPSDEFLSTELQKHSIDVTKLQSWAGLARDAINRNDAVVATRVIDIGVNMFRSLGVLGL